MRIMNFESGPVYTNCYIVYDEISKAALVIDTPPDCADNVLKIAKDKEIKIEALLLTHSHWDHTMDAGILKKETKAPIYIHQDDAYRIINPMEHIVFPVPFEIPAVQPDNYFMHGEIIKFSGMEFEVIHTPGHTEGSVCLVFHKEKVIFSGDTLFEEGVGRTDLPGGDTKQLMDSIKYRLYNLPGDYTVYPGHGPSTSIQNEMKHNPFIR